MLEAGVLEVEAKVPVKDHADVLRRLRALGARELGKTQQEDVFLAGAGLGRDCALRFRRAGDKLELTFKGPRQGGAGGSHKARLEATVALAGDPTEVLGHLGYRPSLQVRKVRQAFRLGTVEVALDDVAGLGKFVEVEAQAEDAKDGAAAVEAALELLQLDGARREALSYAELLSRS